MGFSKSEERGSRSFGGGYMRKKYIEMVIMLWPVWVMIVGVIVTVIIVAVRN